jgi:hypothetical protein
VKSLRYGEWKIGYIQPPAWYIHNGKTNLYLHKDGKLGDNCGAENFWSEKDDAFTFLKQWIDRGNFITEEEMEL